MPKRRYPIVPIVATILKVATVIMLIVIVYSTIKEFQETIKSWYQASSSMGMYGMGGGQAAIKGFGPRLESLLSPLLRFGQGLFISTVAWAAGEMLTELRDIEFNLRAPLQVREEARTQPAIEQKAAPAEEKTTVEA